MSHAYQLQGRRDVSQRPLFRLSIPFIARFFICLACALGASPQARAAVAYVQGASLTSYAQLSATVTYSSAQQAGDLNIVQIAKYNTTSWNSLSVTDSVGNYYYPAGDTGNANFLVFFAANILPAAPGANTVTVTFSNCNPCPSVRSSNINPNLKFTPQLIVNIAEYSGIATNAVDVTVAASGTGATVSSGPVSTTNANDLLVGAYFSTNYPGTATPGAGYTARGGSGGEAFIEDMTVASLGSYSATALSSGASGWTIELIAFRAKSTGSICD